MLTATLPSHGDTMRRPPSLIHSLCLSTARRFRIATNARVHPLPCKETKLEAIEMPLMTEFSAGLAASKQQEIHQNSTPENSPAKSMSVSRSVNSGISALLKRIKHSSTSASLVSTVSEKSASIHTHPLVKLNKKHINISVKAPHYVAGGVVEGTVVVRLPPSEDITLCLNAIQGLVLCLRGVENIADAACYPGPFQFLEQPILSLSSDEIANHLKPSRNVVVPFATQLPLDLGSSYTDRKGSVRYLLQGVLHLAYPSSTSISEFERRTVEVKLPIEVYANAMHRTMADVNLYSAASETCQAWRSITEPQSCLQLNVSMSRTIWMAGTPIYIAIQTINRSQHRLLDIKVELIRRQNTFSAIGQGGSSELVPITSTCKTVAHASAKNLGCWQPIDTGVMDEVTLAVKAPANMYTVRGQKLIDISFLIRLWIMSPTSIDALLEIPVVLVHPISMDPPPGPYLSDQSSSREACRELIKKAFRESSLSNTADEDRDGDQESALLEPLPAPTKTVINKKLPFPAAIPMANRVRRNIAHWLLQRKNSGQILPEPVCAQEGVVEKIRYGRALSPKRFGHHLGCIGDAGLDIRQKFNVATAREVWEGYTAQICTRGGDASRSSNNRTGAVPRITLVSPTASSFGMARAPSEKLEIVPESTNPTRYPRGQGIKRMLASSRYIKALKAKRLPVTKDGRGLLTKVERTA